MRSCVGKKFITGATAEQHVPALIWTTDCPVWVDQWPLSREKLQHLHQLVQEQLQAGHIIPTTSPWNSPVFVIQNDILIAASTPTEAARVKQLVIEAVE